VLGYNVKIRKAFFHVGETVEKGDRLFDLDKTITSQLLYSGGSETSDQESTELTLSKNQQEMLKQAMSTGIISKSTYQNFVSQLTNQSHADSNATTGSQNNQDVAKTLKAIQNQFKAPASGVISAIDDGTNGISKAGSVLAEVIDFHSIQAKVQVNEANIKYLKSGQKVRLTGDGFYGVYSGTVETIYPVAKSTTTASGTQNMVDVLVHINKPDKELLPGLSVNASIQVSKEKGIVKLPYDAVLQDDDGTEYVFVIRNGKAVRQNISTTNEDSENIVVTKGLHCGELVIDDSNNSAINGENVRLQ